MGGFLVIIFFVIYIGYMDYRKYNAVNNYDIRKIDNMKLARDMDKPVHVREMNLLAGKYDYKPGEYNWKEHKNM